MAPQAVEDEAPPSPTPVVTTAPPRPTPSSPSSSSARPANDTTPASGSGNATEDANTTAPAPPSVLVEGHTGALLMAGVPEPSGGVGAEETLAVLDIPRAKPTNATLVATWTSATPLDASMDVSLFDTDGNSIAFGTGASPLALEIPGEAFAQAVELRAMAVPTAPGVAAQYSVHVTLRVTYA